MLVIESAAELRAWSASYRRAGLSVGFVPTLGGLHAGHVALLDTARSECDRVIASIYLNPTQFDRASDLDTYPASRDEDLATCRSAGVHLLYLGRREDLLPAGFQTWVAVEELTRGLCGASRPGHFRGVATVVAQLLHIALPHRAYFGLKDYQQARVIERMVGDLHFDTEIRTVETVREPDGLALSSRNRRLGAGERRRAAALPRALFAVRDAAVAGERRAAVLEARLLELLGAEPAFRVDYASVLDASTLLPFPGGLVGDDSTLLVAAAVFIGSTRLIDNCRVDLGERTAPGRGGGHAIR